MSEERARLTTQMRQPPARENKGDATGGTTIGGKTTCSLQWTGRDTLRHCANFWCVSAYSMEQRPTRTCSKKAHRQRHGTLVVYTQVSSCSQFSQVIHRADSDEKTCLTTVYAAHVPSVILRLDDRKRADIKPLRRNRKQHCRGAVGTSTRAVACALTSKPQPLLILHSTSAVAGTVKNNKVCSFSSVSGTAKIRYTKRKCCDDSTRSKS